MNIKELIINLKNGNSIHINLINTKIIKSDILGQIIKNRGCIKEVTHVKDKQYDTIYTKRISRFEHWKEYGNTYIINDNIILRLYHSINVLDLILINKEKYKLEEEKIHRVDLVLEGGNIINVNTFLALVNMNYDMVTVANKKYFDITFDKKEHYPNIYIEVSKNTLISLGINV